MKALAIVSVLMWTATANATVYDYHADYTGGCLNGSRGCFLLNLYNQASDSTYGFRRGSVDLSVAVEDSPFPGIQEYILGIKADFSDRFTEFGLPVNTVTAVTMGGGTHARVGSVPEEFFNPATGEFLFQVLETISDGSVALKLEGEDYTAVHAGLPGIPTFAGVDAHLNPFVFTYVSLFPDGADERVPMVKNADGTLSFGTSQLSIGHGRYQGLEGYLNDLKFTYLGERGGNAPNGEPACVPEPATIALLAAAGILGARRRYMM